MAQPEGGQVHPLSVIRVLPAAVAEKIAAGEVVERPASVVKELVENSIDAGARRIEIELEEGGKRLVRVTDDGCGMSRPDAELAFARHATSKLSPGQELEVISTLGFRGEALPSIAAVSRVELTTRRRGLDGIRVTVEGGQVTGVMEVGSAYGTTVAVRDLFAALPARLKFMRSQAVEQGHVTELVTRIALAYPEIGIFLRGDGREILRYPPLQHPRERICQVFGRVRAAELREVCHRQNGIAVTGAVLAGGMAFSTSRYLFTYVNRRLVRDRLLNHAIVEGFATLIPKGKQPGAVIEVEVSPQEVDINVHPAKHEVRFLHGHWIHEQVSQAVREALAGKPEMPRSPGGPGAAAPAPGGRPPAAISEKMAPLRYARAPQALAPELGAEGPGLEAARVETFGSLRLVGQVFDGYLVCERAGAVVFIDQHAAHERIVFEKLRAQYSAGRVEQQRLLIPQAVNLGERGAAALQGRTDDLARLGLEIEFFGGTSFLLRAVPVLMRACDWKGLLEDVAAALAETGSAGEMQERAAALVATMACHSAVRVGHKMAPEEAAWLLRELDATRFSSNCPHGRPVALELARGKVERWFGR